MYIIDLKLGSTWEVDETSLAREFTIISAKENEFGKKS